MTRDEVAAFRQVFRVPENEIKNVARVFNQARKDSAGFEPYARQVGRMFKGRPAVLQELMRSLFHIAKADGEVSEKEIIFLAKLAAEMGLDDETFDRLKASEMGSAADDPFAILGIDRDDDENAVKSAHRKLVREHHPDRLIAQGMPDEFVEGANKALASINA
ncbi:MAG: DnaJ family molecular chaperone, partial [Pseudomonadota bacterium]